MELVVRSESGRAGSGVDAAARIQRLLRRKLSEKRRLEHELAELQQEMLALAVQVERARALANEIDEALRGAARRPGLTRRQRSDIESLRRELAEDLLAFGADAGVEESCDCPECRGEVEEPDRFDEAPRGSMRDEAEDTFASSSAGRATRDPSLRELYHRLALHYHPDRADGEDLRAKNADKMREINQAFHEGDTDRLIELSRELGIAMDELRSASGILAEMVAQYERVKVEVRDLRASLPGQLLIERRRARRSGYPASVERMAEDLEGHIEELTGVREFVARFVAGELSVDDLLAGPYTADQDDEEEDPFLVLASLLEATEFDPAALDPRSGPPRRQRTEGARNKRRRRRARR